MTWMEYLPRPKYGCRFDITMEAKSMACLSVERDQDSTGIDTSVLGVLDIGQKRRATSKVQVIGCIARRVNCNLHTEGNGESPDEPDHRCGHIMDEPAQAATAWEDALHKP